MKVTKKYKIALYVLLCLVAGVLAVLLVDSGDVVVLNPKGWIALKESHLIIASTLLMLIVVLPVLVLTWIFSRKYSIKNPKPSKYAPDWDDNPLAEAIWWGLPCLIIIVLSIMTWVSSHELDPYKPIESDAKPITVQVVALPWKWLFIYPELQIASVNFFQFPEHTPVNFQITADAPMNSFWIPQLGGQVFAMPGMKTKLHLIADEVGEYNGVSANLSGKGFSGMRFIAKASTQAEFDEWVHSLQQSPEALSAETYKQLAAPSEDNPVSYYSLKDDNLYEQIVMKYMMPME